MDSEKKFASNVVNQVTGSTNAQNSVKKLENVSNVAQANTPLKPVFLSSRVQMLTSLLIVLFVVKKDIWPKLAQTILKVYTPKEADAGFAGASNI